MKNKIILILIFFVILEFKGYSFDKIFLIDTTKAIDTISNDYLFKINKYPNILLTNLIGLKDNSIDDKSNVIKSKNRLILKLRNSKYKIYTDNPGHPELGFNDNSFVQYIYYKKVNEQYWLIFINYGYPCTGNYELISSLDGETYKLGGVPVVSKDNNFIVTGLADECDGHYFELYKLENLRLRLLTKIYVSKQYLWINKIGWVNNKCFIIEGSIDVENKEYIFVTIK